jgi:hypothetical protein
MSGTGLSETMGVFGLRDHSERLIQLAKRIKDLMKDRT